MFATPRIFVFIQGGAIEARQPMLVFGEMRRHRVRVIVYTGQDDAGLHAWLRELGAEDVVPLSVAPKALAVRLRGKVVSIA